MFVCAHMYADMLLHRCVSQRQILSHFFIRFPLRLFTWWISYFLVAVISSWPRQLTERCVYLSLQLFRGLGSINGQELRAPHLKLKAGSHLLSSQGLHTGTPCHMLPGIGGSETQEEEHTTPPFSSFMPLKPGPHGCCCQAWLPAWGGPFLFWSH